MTKYERLELIFYEFASIGGIVKVFYNKLEFYKRTSCAKCWSDYIARSASSVKNKRVETCIMEFLVLQIFKTQLDKVLSNLNWSNPNAWAEEE